MVAPLRSSAVAAAVFLLLLAPLQISAQSFDPSAARLPPLLQPSDTFQDVCQDFPTASPAGDPPLPTDVPRQFSVHVEANIVNANRTVLVHEFYDDINNRGGLNMVQDGVRVRSIYDYNNNEIFVFPDVERNRECSVYTLTESRRLNFTFGLTRVNGSIHIGSGSLFLLGFLRDDIPVQYMGNDSVRGTPAQRWQACMSIGLASFYVDYYFTTTDIWSYPALKNQEVDFDLTLSQVVVRGNSMFNNTLRNFYHVYSVIDFQSGPESVPDRAFRVPTGTTCVGRISGMPLPEVPSSFSTSLQFVDTMSDLRQVFSVREHYDFEHGLFRLDTYYDGAQGGDAGPLRIIHDFDGQLQYVLNRHTSSCNVTSFSDALFLGGDVRRSGNGFTMATPGTFFFLNSGLNYSYEGVSTVRGVEVDSWIAIVNDPITLNPFANLSNGAMEVFFTRPEYNISSDRSAGEKRVIWRINIRGLLTSYAANLSTNVSYEADFFDFSSSDQPFDVFDVSACSAPDQTHTLALSFPVSRDGIDFSMFRTNLRTSLVSATGLKPLQINNIQYISSNDTSIFVALHFTNLSDLAVVADPSSVVTADQALDMLSGVDGPLPFLVDIGNGMKVAPTLFGRNRGRRLDCNISTCNCPTSMPSTTKPSTTDNPDNITNRLGLSDAVVAGIAVGLFFAGFIIALLFLCFCFICCKCISSRGSLDVSSVKYKKHDDQLDNFS